MKYFKYWLVGILFLIPVTAGAYDFVEPDDEDIKISSRTIYFHGGPDVETISTGLCRTGFLLVKSKRKEVLLDFFQPCLLGGVTLEENEDLVGQIGIGIVEVLGVLSFNTALDSSKRGIYWGTGVSFEFDDSFQKMFGMKNK